MRILVCGGRNYGGTLAETQLLYDTLGEYEHEMDVLIHGGASGADSLAGEWAIGRDIRVQPFPANWARHGKAAGPLRNQQMLDEGKPDLVIAFPGGRGTADMVRRAAERSILVQQVEWTGPRDKFQRSQA